MLPRAMPPVHAPHPQAREKALPDHGGTGAAYSAGGTAYLRYSALQLGSDLLPRRRNRLTPYPARFCPLCGILFSVTVFR